MSTERVGGNQLLQIRRSLDERALSLVRDVAELRLMSGAQLAALHFPPESHDTRGGAARAARRCLAELIRLRLLIRSGRRIGGNRSGSSGYLYTLGPVGQRLVELDGPRRRFREPSMIYTDHTLATSQLVVDLRLATRNGRCELLTLQAEPACWRSYRTGAALRLLRPDLFVILGQGDYEYRFFIEVDRGTHHLPALLRKCQEYQSYYGAGVEQAAHDVFPRIGWIVPNDARAERLRLAIRRSPVLTPELFVITTTDTAVKQLTEGIG